MSDPNSRVPKFLSRLVHDREGHFRGFDRAWVLITRLLALAGLCYVPFSCCFWPFVLGFVGVMIWISFTPWVLDGPRRSFWFEVVPVVLVGAPGWALGVSVILNPPSELRDLPWMDQSLMEIELAAGCAVVGTYLVFLIATRLRLLNRWRLEHEETDAEAEASAASRLGADPSFE